MAHWYKLTCFFFRYFKWFALLSAGIGAAAQLLWLFYAVRQPAYAASTYQSMAYDRMDTPHLSQFFQHTLALLCLSAVVWVLSAFFGKRKALYTLLTLPGPRAALPLALFASMALCIALLFVCECAVLLVGYQVWEQGIPTGVGAALSALQADAPETYAALAGAEQASLLPFVPSDLYLAFVQSPAGCLALPCSGTALLYSLGFVALLSGLLALSPFVRGTAVVLLCILFTSLQIGTALSPSVGVFGVLFLAAGLGALGWAVYLAYRQPAV